MNEIKDKTIFSNGLAGKTYRLEAFTEKHKKGLWDAASNSEIWEFSRSDSQSLEEYILEWYTSMLNMQKMGTRFMYVVIENASNKIVGSSSYYDISIHDLRVAIGFTWYHPDVWGKGVNPEVKYLMLSQVFDKLKWNRVEFHVDSRNERSISAMKYLGATQDGVLRLHKRVQCDFIRDTVLLSIVEPDWPEIIEKIATRLI
ncbi:GNAT family N-acetyltransferase [bacterium]|jgi:N-acetyltransferase|nr:GNAT family N-acetyltransferase [bacterium]